MVSSCTSEKFGERMAHKGGRQLGLFDELLSFFATMNMYSMQKCQASESKEGSDFLQMYTGKSKSRHRYCTFYSTARGISVFKNYESGVCYSIFSLLFKLPQDKSIFHHVWFTTPCRCSYNKRFAQQC